MGWKQVKKFLPIIGIGIFVYLLIKLNVVKILKQIENVNLYIQMYLKEVFEVLVSIIIIRIAIEKEIDIYVVIKESLMIGVLTFLLEFYNPDLKHNVKNGITYTVGTQLIGRHTT